MAHDHAPLEWDGVMAGGGAADLSEPTHSPDDSGHRYALCGKYASGRAFDLPPEIAAVLQHEPEQPVMWPRWHSIAAFLFISMGTIFSLCALGRSGA